MLFTSSGAIKRSRAMSNRFPVNMLLSNFVILHQRRGLIVLIDETFEDIKFAELRTSDVACVNSLHVLRYKILIRGVSKLATIL